MSVAETMRQKLTERFAPVRLEISDESIATPAMPGRGRKAKRISP